jgi:hypothetical protein
MSWHQGVVAEISGAGLWRLRLFRLALSTLDLPSRSQLRSRKPVHLYEYVTVALDSSQYADVLFLVESKGVSL